MCRPKICKNCEKTTWAGCGMHIDQVMKNVPEQDRCKCTAAEKKSTGGFLSKIFGN